MASRVAALSRELKNIKLELRNLAPFIEMVKSCEILLFSIRHLVPFIDLRIRSHRSPDAAKCR
jgi:hypothetical protein